ncbi:hypothetical protein Daus18300_013856 [Diaporthe australafricana]|uniref:Xylanolytic transcriptional activator regulatory domain-containing protein n=1 Tax=Diaporthe australafricana TaxID=127596 RepID=A0ABR3VXN8_9PEZI
MAASRADVGMNPDLIKMLQRLEKAVQTLDAKGSERSEAISSPRHDSLSHEGPRIDFGYSLAPAATLGEATIEAGPRVCDEETTIEVENMSRGQGPKGKARSVSSSHGESPGKIVRDHGRDMYVRRWFWSDEKDEISSVSSSDTDNDDVHQDQGPIRSASTGQHSAMIGNSREKVLQMLVHHKMHLWSIYKERVEPLTRLLHLPSLEQAVMASDPLGPADGMQCVLLAVYYGAVTSLGEEECVILFGDGQAQTLSRMREELKELFAKASLLHTGDIRPLQALTLYLVFLRHHEPRLAWKLSGLAIRLAQNFGLHREDSFLRLTKFETEMRRRLWWQLAIMDAPSAEDYSGEYNLLEMSSFDTHPPQNLNDAQLDPTMTEYPPEAEGITEMTFTLASCQITNMYRCIADSRRMCGNTGKGYAELTSQERADWIGGCESEFLEQFHRICSPTNPFHWVTVVLTKMLFHKVRLHGCNPMHNSAVISERTRERLFLVAVEVMELNYKLRTDPRTRPWRWLFSSYTQWHAFSLVLVWLQIKPFCRNSRRAWEAVEKAVVLRWEHPASLLKGRKPQQWRSIMKLLEEARSARRKASSSRARNGSRNAIEMDEASIRGFPDSTSTAVSTMTMQDSLAGETNVPRVSNGQRSIPHQPYLQEQPIARAPETCAASSLTPPAATTDVSTSAMQVNNIEPRPWRPMHQNAMLDFSTGGIADAMPDPDFMMMDGDFSVEDFEGLQDLSFLDKII